MKIVRSFSIDIETWERASAQARAEHKSFSRWVAEAIEDRVGVVRLAHRAAPSANKRLANPEAWGENGQATNTETLAAAQAAAGDRAPRPLPKLIDDPRFGASRPAPRPK